MPSDVDPIPIAAPELGAAEIERVTAVIESGMVADGPEVRRFEAAFADRVGTAHGVATSNGTTALHAALHACGIGDGDLVLTTPFSFVASANAIRFTGADVAFADIDPATFTLDPAAVRERIAAAGGDVDAILAVHLYGLPAGIRDLREIADDHDALLVEDAAQAHGARVRGEPVGSVGDVGCFSFYPTKNMTTAEGGVVVTDDDAVADRVRQFINHGRTDSYRHASLGHNFRMTSVAAAIGLAQLDQLDDFVAARRENAARLTAGLQDAAVETPVEPDGHQHAYHQYTVRTTDREGLTASLDRQDIGYGIYYPRTIPDQPAYDGWDPETPVAARATEEVLSLPIHPSLDNEARERIIDTVRTHARD